MPFDSGNVSFIICQLPKPISEDALNTFAEFAAKPLDKIGRDETRGWVTGRHLLDTNINEETAYLSGFLYLTLRTAVRKVPGSLFKAECRVEELAYMQANKTFNVPRKQKKQIQESVEDRMLPDMPPALAGIPFVVDSNHNVLYLGATSISKVDAFLDFFHETLGFEPTPLYPEILAETLFGVNRHDIEPLTFTPRSVEVEDLSTCGRDFLTWLWFFQNEEGGTFTLDSMEGSFGVMIEGPLTFSAECQGGAMESVVRKGVPTASAEAKAAMLGGKKLRKAKIRLVKDKEEWSFGLDADSFIISGMKLPEGEKLDPMSFFQERMLYLNIFREAFQKLFGLFIEQASDAKQADDLCQSLMNWTEGLITSLPER